MRNEIGIWESDLLLVADEQYKRGTSRLSWKLGRLGEVETGALEWEVQDILV